MFNFTEGEVLLIDKPYTWTSFDVVNLLKSNLKRSLGSKIKMGHAGTLDPLATGLLVVLTGKRTKEMESIQSQPKEYTGTFMLGATTPSFDREREVDQTYPWEHIKIEDVHKAALALTGDIMQLPPDHSAVKVDGKRAYELARKGREVDIKPRPVTMYEFEITAFRPPEVDFRIVCSKGTYIRSVARDIGKLLDSGAYLSSLCRTRIGELLLKDAMQPREFTQLISRLASEGMLK